MFERILRDFPARVIATLNLHPEVWARIRRDAVRTGTPPSGKREPAAVPRGKPRGVSRGRGTAAALLAAAALGALPAVADYSPLRPGRVWVFGGNGMSTAAYDSARQGTPRISFRQRIRLEVKAVSARADVTYRIEERDSLYDRVSRVQFPVSNLPLPDTVVVRNLVYVERLGGLRLEHGDSLGLFHSSDVDPFFPSRSKAPQGSSLSGLKAPYQGVSVGFIHVLPDPSRAGSTLPIHYSGWYVDEVGPVWIEMHDSRSTCGPEHSGTLWLESLDGRALDLGLSLPGQPVVKTSSEAKIACGLARTAPARGLFRSAAESPVNALGRLCAPPGRSPGGP